MALPEWETEPDFLEWQDVDTGYQCRIIRVEFSGHLCGYVGLPKDHPFAKLEADDALPTNSVLRERDFCHDRNLRQRFMERIAPTDSDYFSVSSLCDVHGGVTYSGEGIGDDDFWWFGFDCAHSSDMMPKMPSYGSTRTGTYRNLAYVQKECTNLAQQLKLSDEEVATENMKDLI